MRTYPINVGETTVSVQHRCGQWGVHSGNKAVPYPCEQCFSLIQTNVVVPYLPRTGFEPVVEGAPVRDRQLGVLLEALERGANDDDELLSSWCQVVLSTLKDHETAEHR